MRVHACLALLWIAVLGAGCAEAPETATDNSIGPDAPGQEPSEEPLAGALSGRLVAEVAPDILQGMPFNVTLSYVDDALANATQLAWQVAFRNATHNVAYNGTGLPAAFQANVSMPGNVTLAGNATDGVSVVELEPVVLWVETGAIDPCAGAVLEPATISGTFTAAVAGSGFYSSNPFSVPDCVGSLHATVTGGGAMIDIMLRLRDGSDAQTLATSNTRTDATEELGYAPEGGIAAGTYNLNVRGQIAGPGDYKGTITFFP